MKQNSYKNTEARGGTPMHHPAHDAALKNVDSKTSHLTSPSGSPKQAGNQGPKESTHQAKSTMPAVKKIAGKSSY